MRPFSEQYLNYNVSTLAPLQRLPLGPLSEPETPSFARRNRSIPLSYFAVSPPELIRPCILACDLPADVVLDPIMSSSMAV